MMGSGRMDEWLRGSWGSILEYSPSGYECFTNLISGPHSAQRVAAGRDLPWRWPVCVGESCEWRQIWGND